MLKVSRHPLSIELQQRLDDFDKQLGTPDTPKDPWKAFTNKEAKREKANQSTIRQTLYDMFHEKCAYCESLVKDSAEIDHYLPKTITPYPGQTRHPMFDWDNLLLCCHNCNHKKGSKMEWDNHQPRLLNPCQDDPLKYLKIDLDIDKPLAGRIKSQDGLNFLDSQRAEYTYTTTLGLNERGLPKKRLRIFREFIRLLTALHTKGASSQLDEPFIIDDTIMDSKVTVGDKLLELINPSSEYLAPIRQFLHEYPKYRTALIEKLPQAHELINQWDLP